MKFDPPEVVDYARYKDIKLSLDDNGVMTLTLSNPGRRNAVTTRMVEELAAVWDDLWLDANVKVIIVTGADGDFCSGADVSQLADAAVSGGKSVAYVNSVTRHSKKHVLGIIECEKPVLAKVRGVAYGMGLSMALACDMVFVSETARLCDSHVRMGLVCGDGGVLLWPLEVGMHRAKEYMMTGEPFSGKKAEELGLVNRCLPDDELDAHVQAMAEKLAALPPHAVNYTKVSINQALKQMTKNAFETSIAYEIYSMKMHDAEEATRAFMEKRKGDFTGN